MIYNVRSLPLTACLQLERQHRAISISSASAQRIVCGIDLCASVNFLLLPLLLLLLWGLFCCCCSSYRCFCCFVYTVVVVVGLDVASHTRLEFKI